MKRIQINENRLNELNIITNDLNNILDEFNIKDFILLNKYYGSKNWFKDKSDFEQGKYPNLKAGVLSEDEVWNLDENMSELISKMKSIINEYEKNKTRN